MDLGASGQRSPRQEPKSQQAFPSQGAATQKGGRSAHGEKANTKPVQKTLSSTSEVPFENKSPVENTTHTMTVTKLKTPDEYCRKGSR